MNEKNWAMLIHLSVFSGYLVPFAGLVVPILIWQLKKNEFPSIDAHGKMVMNFILSMLIYGVICFALCFVFIGFPLLFALSIAGIVLPIIGAIKANDGILWNYPLMIQFFK